MLLIYPPDQLSSVSDGVSKRKQAAEYGRSGSKDLQTTVQKILEDEFVRLLGQVPRTIQGYQWTDGAIKPLFCRLESILLAGESSHGFNGCF